MHIAHAQVGKRAFLGNSGMTAPGRAVPKNGLVAVLSAAPAKAKKGSSWLGSPPVRLRRAAGERRREPHVRTRRRGSRSPAALVELCRLVPVIVPSARARRAVRARRARRSHVGSGAPRCSAAWCCWPPARSRALVTIAAKWLLVGRIGRAEHPLWSSFVWRNEVADTFVEMVAAPWFARAATGTAVLNLVAARARRHDRPRRVVRDYWLPEADLVTLGDGATVNAGASCRPTCSMIGS